MVNRAASVNQEECLQIIYKKKSDRKTFVYALCPVKMLRIGI